MPAMFKSIKLKSTKTYLLIYTSLFCTQLSAIGQLNPVLLEQLKKYNKARSARLASTSTTRPTLAVVAPARLTVVADETAVSTRDTRYDDTLAFILSNPFH